MESKRSLSSVAPARRLLAGALLALGLTGCASSGTGPPTPPLPAGGGSGAEPASSVSPPSTAEGAGGEAAREPAAVGDAAGGEQNSAGSEVESDDPEEGAAAASGAARTEGEVAEGLDGRLDESLSEFDRLLLGEQERLAARAASAPPAGAAGGSGGSAGGAAGSGGSGGGAAGDESTSGDSTDFATGEAPTNRAREGAEGGDEEAEARGDRVPPDVGSGDDDDIVARQLREAAISEEDPELRAKLWDEYRAYKGLPPRAGGADEGADD